MNFNNTTQIGCADILGFNRNQSPSAATTIVADRPANFNPYQSLFINIDQCSSRYSNPLKSNAVLGCIHVPIAVNSGSVIQIRYSDMPIMLYFDNVSTLNFQVRDSSGKVVSLGSEFELQIIKV
jgi:hypothetical protein